MERRVTATEARVHFGELLRDVNERGSIVVVERGGQPQAVVLSMDEYRRLRAGENPLKAWLERTDRVAAAIQRELAGRPLPDIDEPIDQGHEERDDALIGHLRRR